MRRVAASVVLVVLVSGCASHAPPAGAGETGAATLRGQDPSDLGTAGLPDPAYLPIDDATTPTANPGPLAPEVDQAAVRAAAGAGGARLDGERFALLAAQVISETRDERRGRDVIDEIASPMMPPALRAYLVQDAAVQRRIGTRRHLDASQEMWFRSKVTAGTDQAATQLRTEVVADEIGDALDFDAWYLQQIDVVRVDGVWSVLGYSTRSAMPEKPRNITPAERQRLLTGKGWRRIAPAGG